MLRCRVSRLRREVNSSLQPARENRMIRSATGLSRPVSEQPCTASHPTPPATASQRVSSPAGLTCEQCRSWVDGRAYGCSSDMDMFLLLERHRPLNNLSKNFTTGFTTARKVISRYMH